MNGLQYRSMSNRTVDGWPVLNPFPPSVFLPPQTAYEAQVSRYILVGTLGAYVWDILNNIQRDYVFVTRYTRLRLPIIIYFLSKLGTLGFVLYSAIYNTAPISDCLHGIQAAEVLFAIGVPSTSLLFFFRAHAVFGMHPFAFAFFGVLWLAVLAGCLATITGATGINIGPTPYCIIGGAKPYLTAGTITPLINDGIVFFAISWRLWRNSWAPPTIKNGIRTMIFGDYLPSFSKSMLQDGQIYFLTTLTANLLTVIMAYASSFPFPYRTMFIVPNAALMNIMACRVHRETFLGISDNQISYHSDSHHSNLNQTAPIFSLKKDTGKKQEVGRTTDNLTVNLTKTVEYMV